MPQKIRLSSSADGSGAYTLLINPNRLILNIGGDYSDFEVLDDSPVVQRWAFDGRPRRMIWPGGLRTSHADMSSQVETLRGYIGLIKYIHFGDAYYGPVAQADSWHKHRIVDLLEEIRPGGIVKWESIELLFKKEA